MTHRYGQSIPVTVGGERGEPVEFEWRGARYRIAEVLATWHLRDRWWLAPTPTPAPPLPAIPAAAAAAALTTATASAASDRQYYRVRCDDEQIFDLYYDAADGAWRLDRAHD